MSTISDERVRPAPASARPAERRRTVVAMVVLVALVAAAFAVPLALRSGPAAHTVAVRGWAYADQPLTGATVSIRTAGGRTVVRDRTDAIGPSGDPEAVGRREFVTP